MNRLQDTFRMTLLTVVSGAFSAAGYLLQERPLQWSRGLYRFTRAFDDTTFGYIDVQHLAYVVEDAPSRFSVTLTRTDQPDPGRQSLHPAYRRRTLAALVVEDFGVNILPAADHWWTYRDITELGRALGEAGSLIVGFGLQWLSGELTPR